MPTRLHSVVFDAADPAGLARFWAAATGWPITEEEPDEVTVEPPAAAAGSPTAPGLPLVFGRVDDPKVGKNRVHVDLNSQSDSEFAEVVDRVRAAGARPVDIGQGEASWEVFADPEGNEFCVLRPRASYADAGPIAAVVLDTPDPGAIAKFWAAATGRTGITYHDDGDVGLAPPGGRGPHLELLRVDDPKVGKNRVHLDVAPRGADDQASEVARLRALGATDVDVGQGEQTWVVLADPHGNELCVLSARD